MNKRDPRHRAIKTVVRCYNDMVLVFDAAGEQLPEYQGTYAQVSRLILADAPANAVFARFPPGGTELQTVAKELW